MPLYEYVCERCHKNTEALQRFDDPPLAECPHCGGPLRKLLSAPAFQFKGSGWYLTDYAKKSSSGEGGGKEKASEKPSEKSGASTSSGDKSAGAATGDSATTSAPAAPAKAPAKAAD